MTDNISPGERRELRSVVKQQYKVLRAEVKRREQELKGEIETELLERYRDEDAAIAQAKAEIRRVAEEAQRQAHEIADRLREAHPDLTVEAGFSRYGGGLTLEASNSQRHQMHRALISTIPSKVGDANLALDRQEADLLRTLSAGALSSDEAQVFLGAIPTVGELVPAARLRELESSLVLEDEDYE